MRAGTPLAHHLHPVALIEAAGTGMRDRGALSEVGNLVKAEKEFTVMRADADFVFFHQPAYCSCLIQGIEAGSAKQVFPR